MNFQHATIWLSHDKARVILFEDQQFPVRRFRNEIELRPMPRGREAAEDFLDELCRAIEAIPQLLLTGTPEAITDFERHMAARRPRIARSVVGVQRVEKPSNARLSALTRWHFTKPADLSAAAG